LLSVQAGLVVSGVVGEVPELARLSAPEGPQAVLVDARHPDSELTRQVKEVLPRSGLLFVVESYELNEILPLLKAEAAGCVSRGEPVAELARAVIACGRGEISLPSPVAARALAALARSETVSASPNEPLSERETEVLCLLARGLTNKGIAQELFVSVRTVEAHLRGVFAKLGVRSRTEAALWAVERGFGAGG
jgi:DNA-binding NarL/FixJ family response regulator